MICTLNNTLGYRAQLFVVNLSHFVFVLSLFNLPYFANLPAFIYSLCKTRTKQCGVREHRAWI